MAHHTGLFPNICLRRSNSFRRYSSYLPLTQSHSNSIVAGIVRQATGVYLGAGAWKGYGLETQSCDQRFTKQKLNPEKPRRPKTQHIAFN